MGWQKGVNSGKMTKSRFVEVTSSNPAKLLNIYPQKGKIAVGSDADLVIWDPAATRTLGKEEQLSKCDFSIYEGIEVNGAPEYVIFRGRLVTDQGLFRPMTGYGQFVPLPPFPPLLYDKMREKKESGSVQAVPRSEEDMATTNGIDQEDPLFTHPPQAFNPPTKSIWHPNQKYFHTKTLSGSSDH